MTEDGLMLDIAAGPGATSDGEDWDGLASDHGDVDNKALYLELDGWEGPLDLLLDLARRQKVDLKSISISRWLINISIISSGPRR